MTDHHGVVDVERIQVELNTLNSVVVNGVLPKIMTTHELMSCVLKTEELCRMLPNLAKQAAKGLLLPLSIVDYDRGFSTLCRLKQTFVTAN